jgi:UPF0755 protein
MRKLLFISSALIVVITCGLIIVGGIPALANAHFGPPGKNVSTWQHIYLSFMLLRNSDQLTVPFDENGQTKAFEVVLGQSPAEIADNLQNNGLIPDANALLIYLVYKGLDTTLQAGQYALSARMTPIQIAHALQDATPLEITFNILSGWRLEEIAASLETSGLTITPQEFLNAAYHPPSDSNLTQHLLPEASLEGFIPPGTYQIPRETSADELVTYLVNNFIAQLEPELLAGFQQRGLNLFQAVTLASIIQREAIIEDEMPLIASVFLNRLALDMKLESDPTVQYAIGYDPVGKTWWKNPLTHADLEIDSPFNTYLYAGLPPGPISNPSYNALSAVANPANSTYLFFRAKCDGSGEHLFAETFDEHLKNACP